MHLPDLPDLPVRRVLDEVCAALRARGAAVLVAPPGTGKTTLVPLALAADGPARVVVAEPRRLAARAAAARMAALLGEPVGRTVGYAVRGESRVSPGTRVEVVTSGLLLRRLAADPELPGVGAVMLDECHERHLDADLLLALLLDARCGLRPDLRVLATSATLAAHRPAALLGEDDVPAPVLEVAAATHPVEVRHNPPVRGESIEACVARAVGAALRDGTGDVLAFLPGVAEIRRTAAALTGCGAAVLPLHGRLTAAEQDAALRPGPGRRVVLATAVAESSLTVPGVRAVVDAGLARVPRTDHRRGLSGLVTIRVSAAVATQRAGRAGREAPGRVHRCWPAGEQLPPYPEPEIRTADLTRLALDLAVWGTPDGAGLRWWDPPPVGPLDAGREVLRALGAVDAAGTATERGRRMAELGLHPRLARALLDGAGAVGTRAAAEVVALLDDDTLATGEDVDTTLAALRAGSAPGAGRWRREVVRLQRLLENGPATTTGGDPVNPASRAALVVGLAHPERLARRRPGGTPVYLMAGGTAVEAGPGTTAPWLAVATADRTPGAVHGRVRLAAAADRELAERAARSLLGEGAEVGWADGDVRARTVRRLGAIVLAERDLADPDPARVRDALVAGLRAEGTGLLRWGPAARSLRARLDLLHREVGAPWPAVDEPALLAGLDDPAGWLAGPLAGARRRADLARIDAGSALRELVGWPLAGQVEELAPERVTVPSGSRIAVDYSGERPVLPVRVQEVFGWSGAGVPRIAGRPLLLHLLSPAGRPTAVTEDLGSFWETGYPQVRSELRGRYPKHAWPEDPLSAAPVRGAPRRR